MQHENEPTESETNASDIGLGTDLFGDPITEASLAAARAVDDYDMPSQNLDWSPDLSADEWELLEEALDEHTAERAKQPPSP